ncbi:MAG: DUF4236 domain-containing protein [Hyphomicrobiales bacterium]|nr:DUF4236 domain-containing protein [Hyphomicrobiales bacterium]MBV8826329.1 DUF4236 domain-containing protein [Hyphomicrobiales bacterium]
MPFVLTPAGKVDDSQPQRRLLNRLSYSGGGVGFRFRKSLRIVPGIRLNLSRSGPSLSLGGKGFRYNIGATGTRVTVGIPGTGLSWSQYSSHSQRRSAQLEGDNAPVVPLLQSQIPAGPVLTPITSSPADKLVHSLQASSRQF